MQAHQHVSVMMQNLLPSTGTEANSYFHLLDTLLGREVQSQMMDSYIEALVGYRGAPVGCLKSFFYDYINKRGGVASISETVVVQVR